MDALLFCLYMISQFRFYTVVCFEHILVSTLSTQKTTDDLALKLSVVDCLDPFH